jgi:hypothetical protein
MTISTTNITLLDLFQYLGPTVLAINKSRHVCKLINPIPVVKLQDNRIDLPAIAAWIRFQVFYNSVDIGLLDLFASYLTLLSESSSMPLIISSLPSLIASYAITLKPISPILIWPEIHLRQIRPASGAVFGIHTIL